MVHSRYSTNVRSLLEDSKNWRWSPVSHAAVWFRGQGLTYRPGAAVQGSPSLFFMISFIVIKSNVSSSITTVAVIFILHHVFIKILSCPPTLATTHGV